MKAKYALLSALICIVASSVNAQKTWDKPFQKWSKEDAQKVLTGSPWMRTYQPSEGTAAIDKEAEPDNVRIARGSRTSDAKGQTKDIAVPTVTIRLHSSPVVRQAFLRLQQIVSGYDKMDDAKKAEFDAANKDLIDCVYCKNYYIVTMAKSADSSRRSVEEALFQTITPAQMKGNVWLENESGTRSELAQYIQPKSGGDMAIFFFPRRDKEGKELIAPTSKSFKFMFKGEFFNSTNPYSKMIPHSFEFEVDKIVKDNSLLF